MHDISWWICGKGICESGSEHGIKNVFELVLVGQVVTYDFYYFYLSFTHRSNNFDNPSFDHYEMMFPWLI